MKLYLLFIALDLLTLLVYPILFMHGKLRQFPKIKENITPTNSLANALAVPGE